MLRQWRQGYISGQGEKGVLNELTKSTRDWPSPDIQFTSVDDAGQLEEHREPAFHPHAVLLRNIEIFPSMLAEHLL